MIFNLDSRSGFMARAMVVVVFALASLFLATESYAQRSAQQLIVFAGTVTRQIEDAKKLATCINSNYREELVKMGKLWLQQAEILQFRGDPEIVSRARAIRVLLREIEAKTACLKSVSTPIDSRGSSVRMGNNAGEFVVRSKESVFVGSSAGRATQNSPYSVLVGFVAGYNVKSSPYAVLLGNSAGESLENAPSAVAIGGSAGRHAKSADHAIFLGGSAGYDSWNVAHSTFIGYAAGRFIKDNNYSIIAGYAAGEYAHRSHNSILMGSFAGYEADNSPKSVMIGHDAGMFANKSESSVMIGLAAGKSASDAVNPVLIGVGAGYTAVKTVDVVLIGTGADAEPGIENAVGIGRGANPSQSNTWHIPETLNVGVGTSAPTAQLHTTRDVRFSALPNGVLVTDQAGNVSASSLLNDALKEIANLRTRVNALEAKKCRP